MNGRGRRTLRDRQPKYLTIHSDLRERIMSGQWSPGHPLPAQRELAGEFGVSIMTVRQALQLLTDDGLIDTRHGSGTYVAAHYAYDLGNLRSFASDLAAQGAQITTQLLGKGLTKPPAHVAARLGDPGEVLWLRRLRLVSGRPLIVQTSYLPVQQVGQIDPSDLIDPGLYTVLAQRGLTVVRAEETISMTILSPADAGDLDRPGASHALLSRRTSFSADDVPVIDDYALLAGDAVAITVNRSSGQLDVRYELTVPHGENRGSAYLPPDYLVRPPRPRRRRIVKSQGRLNGEPICGHFPAMNPRSVGVEEEFLLVEPGTGRPKAVAATVLQAAGPAAGSDLEAELQQQQLETNSRPCQSLDDLHRELRRCRASAAVAAGRAEAQVAALGTSPLPVEPRPVRTSRYQRMAELFGLTAHEQLTCGCHVHVGLSSADEGVAVLDRAGPWLAVLLALSANSPFWQGRDSEYASFRYQVWSRWPSSGPTEPFRTVHAYRETIQQMVGTGTLLDTGMVYFNARLSERYPTIEIRIADVCLRADDAVLIAALARALVETEARAWRQGKPVLQTRTELLRLAAWRASRSGLDAALLNPVTGLPEQAATVVDMLLVHCRDALADAGDEAVVANLLAALLARGNGAAFQRTVYRRSGRLSDVIRSAVAVTGVSPG
jgi:glutamate---cysteine ligase / carboxylate-amine ligase